MIDFQKKVGMVFYVGFNDDLFGEMRGHLMNDAFLLWLESNDCHDMLLLCSDQVITRARKKAICLETIFQDALTDGLTQLSGVVAHEMWQFLKEKSRRITDKASAKLVHGDVSGFMEVLIGVFLDHCKDKRRTFGIDPIYAYYRSIRDTLSDSKDVVATKATRKGTFYAFSFDASIQRLPDEYWDQSYHQWPQPPFAESQIYENQAILELARFFWIEALDRFTEAYFLPIKELCRFLNSKYQIGCTINAESNSCLAQPDDAGGTRTVDDISVHGGHADDQLGLHLRQNPRIEMDLIETELESLAQDCLATLTDIERKVLFKSDAKIKMADIALELGMKTASNISPYKDSAFRKLKKIWSLWGPVDRGDFTDVDESEFWLFYDKVIELCKINNHCRI